MHNGSIDDDVQLAIALSLSEAESKHRNERGAANLLGTNPPSPVDHTASDEALARALQEEYQREGQQHHPGHSHGPPYHPPSTSSYPSPPPSSQQPHLPNTNLAPFIPAPAPVTFIDPNACAGCGKSLTSLGGLLGSFGGRSSYITALGKNWHPACFNCASCKQPFPAGIQFNVGEDGQPYHSECYRNLFHPKCRVCNNFLPTEEGGSRISWSEIPFWKDKHCPVHNEDGTKRCTSCTRMQPAGEQWVDLDDGRALCLSCLSTMIVDTQACGPLYDDILNFYASKGMPLPAKPPLLLVEQSALNSSVQRETSGRGRGDGPVFHTRGLCLTEYSTIKTVVRRPGVFPFSVAEELVNIGPTKCEVTAILVLYGLPRLLTGSILAHECMHAWLRLSGFHNLAPEIEEGLCQLMALLWLEGQASTPGKFSDAGDERLAAFFGNQIRTDRSIVYGDGFRAAHEAFQRFGLKTTLDTVHRTGRLPQ